MIGKIRESARTYIADLARLTCIESTRQTISVPGVTLSETREDSCDTKQYKLFAAQTIALARNPVGYDASRRPRSAPPSDSASSPLSDRFKDASLEASSEFLEAVINPDKQADFHGVRSKTLNGHEVAVFSFDVPVSDGYVLVDRKRIVRVPYQGQLYADPVTGALIRAELRGVHIPRGLEYVGVDLTLDFKPFDVSGRSIDLPSHSRAHFQMAWGEATNEADYRTYRLAEFTSDSQIQFDTESVEEKR